MRINFTKFHDLFQKRVLLELGTKELTNFATLSRKSRAKVRSIRWPKVEAFIDCVNFRADATIQYGNDQQREFHLSLETKPNEYIDKDEEEDFYTVNGQVFKMSLLARLWTMCGESLEDSINKRFGAVCIYFLTHFNVIHTLKVAVGTQMPRYFDPRIICIVRYENITTEDEDNEFGIYDSWSVFKKLYDVVYNDLNSDFPSGNSTENRKGFSVIHRETYGIEENTILNFSGETGVFYNTRFSRKEITDFVTAWLNGESNITGSLIFSQSKGIHLDTFEISFSFKNFNKQRGPELRFPLPEEITRFCEESGVWTDLRLANFFGAEEVHDKNWYILRPKPPRYQRQSFVHVVTDTKNVEELNEISGNEDVELPADLPVLDESSGIESFQPQE
ncbi:hypothetical protein L3Y34_012746 [Caenorhabditis briggsae]|uniref:F-box associated domain-containing protein n=1 Tax=Caenorhabditis briggsae TaxID=6238 RepID=A0AAE8ZV15_CAEBR|nr:hypothetical protein L3Y34_012746 [Caenorhabditis briggsae]